MQLPVLLLIPGKLCLLGMAGTDTGANDAGSDEQVLPATETCPLELQATPSSLGTTLGGGRSPECAHTSNTGITLTIFLSSWC